MMASSGAGLCTLWLVFQGALRGEDVIESVGDAAETLIEVTTQEVTQVIQLAGISFRLLMAIGISFLASGVVWRCWAMSAKQRMAMAGVNPEGNAGSPSKYNQPEPKEGRVEPEGSTLPSVPWLKVQDFDYKISNMDGAKTLCRQMDELYTCFSGDDVWREWRVQSSGRQR